METINPNKALWEKGDFTQIAQTMRQSGEELVAKLGITKGMKVLDLGCGDGTTAIPEATRGAEVLGIVAITGLGGLLFGWLFVRWGFSLWPPIFLHMGMNSLWIAFDLGENAIGGLLGNVERVVVVVLAIALTLWLTRRRQA